MGLVNYVDGALDQCEIFRAFDKAPHIPIAGTYADSAFNEKVQVLSFKFRRVSRTLKKYGMSLAARRLLLSEGQSVFRRTGKANRDMEFERTLARSVVASPNFRECAPLAP